MAQYLINLYFFRFTSIHKYNLSTASWVLRISKMDKEHNFVLYVAWHVCWWFQILLWDGTCWCVLTKASIIMRFIPLGKELWTDDMVRASLASRIFRHLVLLDDVCEYLLVWYVDSASVPVCLFCNVCTWLLLFF